MIKRWRPVRDEQGQGVPMLLLVVVVVAVTVFFLAYTLILGLDINDKAEKIARTGRGINSSTDAILQLDNTERLGDSIEATTDVQNVNNKVLEIVRLTESIDRLATSIEGSGNAINDTARGINSTASAIQGTARRINNGVELINRNVDGTINLARQINGDTGPILVQLQKVRKNAACIDNTVVAGTGTDGHC